MNFGRGCEDYVVSMYKDRQWHVALILNFHSKFEPH
jgi:hypothetical protein